ncbi:flagellar hook capping FlgD N-terminal domain-containing protein [Dermatophilus congolensis]|uniref:flagellar hook capping FlgD N-terminal domain-containing protein n=1 Tax=Dermatophilus congolensis TaxID=1863 RepID=UPI001AAEB3B3|nr:flagellar hook capping FlgD N-terminal domain-containing protein [Dermatophilus congolensis]MBO3143392.1 hypothetical protein [Dermatophilus congolensis]MBO3152382.1 hypothetical protein [Dermatophilus congolensis]MBO3160607.1 hypothetical protein [Dermatophilus congolensis]MBO3163670.1 hypothetical protein [Dermatophilus congolensis]MBO3177216.1 hypothetical protein [Dermatophilus congolensis]
MTDTSGITNSTTSGFVPTTSSPTSSSTGSAQLGTATVNGQTVTIVQPDGSKYTFTMPRATSDGKGGWTSVTTPEMQDLAKETGKKYGTTLKADDFMKLLVAQFQYQDPSKPADTTQMMQQTASMGMIERINEMASAAEAMTKSSESLAAANKELVTSNTAMTQHLGSLLAQQSLSAAIGLIGQTVTYTKGTGDTATTEQGTVESVKIGTNGPILKVNGTDVPVDSITAVARGTATQA